MLLSGAQSLIWCLVGAELEEELSLRGGTVDERFEQWGKG